MRNSGIGLLCSLSVQCNQLLQKAEREGSLLSDPHGVLRKNFQARRGRKETTMRLRHGLRRRREKAMRRVPMCHIRRVTRCLSSIFWLYSERDRRVLSCIDSKLFASTALNNQTSFRRAHSMLALCLQSFQVQVDMFSFRT